jgi:hypothetical protein
MNNFMCGWMVGFMMALVGPLFAADLVIPRSSAERCLVAGENGLPDQTLHEDKRCKSGLRWIYVRP